MADAGETLDKDQFVAFMEQFEWKSRDEMKEILRADFEYFDKDKSGLLDPTELTAILTQYGHEGLPEEEVNELISSFDKDGDGNINIDGIYFSNNSVICWFVVIQPRLFYVRNRSALAVNC